MALKAHVASLDGIDARFHELYEEGDGGLFLAVEGIGDHPGAKALKSALDRERAAKKQAVEKARALEDRFAGLADDVTAETFNDLQNRIAGSDPKEIDERLRKQREADDAKLQREVGSRDQRIQKLDRVLHARLIDGGLTDALIAAGVDKHLLPAARALLKEGGRIKLVEHDDGFDAVADTGIDPEAPLGKYVADWANSDAGKPFVSKPTGSDAKGGAGARFVENPWDTQGGKLRPNLTKQQEAIKANPERARQMAVAAGAVPTW